MNTPTPLTLSDNIPVHDAPVRPEFDLGVATCGGPGEGSKVETINTFVADIDLDRKPDAVTINRRYDDVGGETYYYEVVYGAFSPSSAMTPMPHDLTEARKAATSQHFELENLPEGHEAVLHIPLMYPAELVGGEYRVEPIQMAADIYANGAVEYVAPKGKPSQY